MKEFSNYTSQYLFNTYIHWRKLVNVNKKEGLGQEVESCFHLLTCHLELYNAA